MTITGNEIREEPSRGETLGEPHEAADVETQRSTIMLDTPLSRILRIRMPWLIVALAGGFLAGGVTGA